MTRAQLRLAIAALAVLSGLLAAGPIPAAPTTARSASLVVGKSSFGPILFDGRGYALYAFTHDSPGHATCYAACARAWPPFVVRARPVAGDGARAARIGVTRRTDGKLQVTYAGRTLYFYVGDGRGQVLCQNVKEFGGFWLVVRGSGKLAR